MTELNVGITGTRQGLDFTQERILDSMFALLDKLFDEVTIEHGDCIGVDQQAHNMAIKFEFAIFIHPPKNDKHRAFCKGGAILEPEEYLQRNQNIVMASDILLAFPTTENYIPHSGTWYTIGYAQEEGIPVIITPRIQAKLFTED